MIDLPVKVYSRAMGQHHARRLNDANNYGTLNTETDGTTDIHTEFEPVRELCIAAFGTGGSGKTITLKRLRNLVDGFSKDEMANHRASIVQNMFVTMIHMINYALPKDKDEKRNYSVLEHSSSKKHVQKLLNAALKFDKEHPEDLIERAYMLWRDEPIFRQVYEKRHEIQFPCEHAIQMLESYQQFMDDKKDISSEWCVKAQLKTVGICQSEFLFDVATKIRWIDTGGQHSERKKWQFVFDKLDGVLYFASLSEFLETCYEDERTNRMQDSLDAFAKVVNDPRLENKPVILCLNKVDLFKKRIEKFDLSWLFPALPADLRTTSNEDRTSDSFVVRNILFIAEQYLATIEKLEKREWVRKNLQICSMTDETEFKRVMDACVEIFGSLESKYI